MSLKVPDTGLIELLTRRKTAFSDLRCRLFQNNYTPVAASVLTDFTECDFTGYPATGILIASWGAVSIVSLRAQVDGATCVFTRSAGGVPQLIYGYYITSASLLLWAERDPAGPFTVTLAGDNYGVIPRFTDRSEF